MKFLLVTKMLNQIWSQLNHKTTQEETICYMLTQIYQHVKISYITPTKYDHSSKNFLEKDTNV
jgi:CII-binding regulator of phage lambda lysogenization HflD